MDMDINLDKDLISRISAAVDRSLDDIVNFCSDLVRIPSINPRCEGVNFNETVGGEAKCNQYIKRSADGVGFYTDIWEPEPKRANLVVVKKGTGGAGGRSLILNGHIDTVPVGNKEEWKWQDPFSGKIENNRIYGRGAADMKSGVTAAYKAIEILEREGIKLKGDVILQIVIGEETMSHQLGTSNAIERGYKADAAIVTEPSAPPSRLCVMPASCGMLWFKVTVTGKPTHSSVRYAFIRPGQYGDSLAVSAIDKANFLLNAMKHLEERWGIEKKHELFEPGQFTIHPGVIRGAAKGLNDPFIVSEFCTIDFAAWYPPDVDADSIKREITEYIQNVSKLDSWLSLNPPSIQWVEYWPPTNTDKSENIVQYCISAHTAVVGTEPKLAGFCAVCDAAFLNAKGIPSIIYGPGDILNAHAVNEYVDIIELVRATKTLALVAASWCGAC